jgi:Tol biopolymer transport system component
MLPDGKDLRQLWPKNPRLVDQCCGKWSADGKLFFFLEGQRFGDIWVADGERISNPVRLTTGPLGYSSVAPSEDGKSLFAVGTQQRAELTRYDPGTKTFMPFLGGISALDVDISKDGAWVTYVAYPEHTIWICKFDGSQRRQMTFPPVQGFQPRWSPDGSSIVFTDLRRARIYTMSRDAGTPIPMIREDKENEIDPT